MKKNSINQWKIVLVILMAITSSSLFSQTLLFEYDTAGNQTKRWICYSNCDTTGKTVVNDKNKSNEENDLSQLEEMFTLYPNPTKGLIRLEWDSNIESEIKMIELVGNSSMYYKELNIQKSTNAIELDISNEYTGMYVFIITFHDGTQITKKLIKQ